MSASISCSSFKLAAFILFLAVNFLMAQVLAWRKQMARVQNRKDGQRTEIYPNPLILFGTVELPTQMGTFAFRWLNLKLSLGKFEMVPAICKEWPAS